MTIQLDDKMQYMLANLTLNRADTVVNVEALLVEECRRTISYLKGYSYPKLYCKKLSNQKPTANTVSFLTRKTTLYCMRAKSKELLFIKLT